MNGILKTLLSVLCLCLFAPTYAQYPVLWSESGGLCFRANQIQPKYSIMLDGIRGLEWINNGTTLTIDTNSRKAAIYSSANCIRFYDADSDTYMSIRCSYFTTPSDRRFKEDIVPLSESEAESASISELIVTAERLSGDVGATSVSVDPFLDNLMTRYPDLVQIAENGAVMVNYTEIVPLLVFDLQKLRQEMDAQEERINELKKILE